MRTIMEKEKSQINVELEYIDSPNEFERLTEIAKILSEGVYSYLIQEKLLRFRPNRDEKVKNVLDETRKITDKEINGFGVDSA